MAFQEVDIQTLSFNPFDKIGRQWMLITAGDSMKSNTMTASWGGVGIMWGKPVVTAYIRPQRYTKEFVDGNDRFTISFLPEDKREALNICGSVSGSGSHVSTSSPKCTTSASTTSSRTERVTSQHPCFVTASAASTSTSTG